jgi:hypothetical protein
VAKHVTVLVTLTVIDCDQHLVLFVVRDRALLPFDDNFVKVFGGAEARVLCGQSNGHERSYEYCFDSHSYVYYCSHCYCYIHTFIQIEGKTWLQEVE